MATFLPSFPFIIGKKKAMPATMTLTENTWFVYCPSMSQKQQAFDYAEKCGMKYDLGSYKDQDFYLVMGQAQDTLFSYPKERLRKQVEITLAQFRALCNAHAGWSGTIAIPEFVSEQPLPMDVLHGLNLIHDERQHQVLGGRSTVEGDDAYTEEQLHFFAQYWLTRPTDVGTRALIEADLCNKHGWNHVAFHYLKKSPEQRLAIAGALIAAELDRLHRLSLKK